MHILNNDYYGHMLVPMEPSHILQDEIDQFIFLKLEAMGKFFLEIYISEQFMESDIVFNFNHYF